MLLIIEILLAVSAWRKGWHAAALIPIVVGFLVAFFVGAIIGESGIDTGAALIFGLLVDVGIIVTLAIMIAKAPHQVNEKTESAEVKKLEKTSYAPKTL